MPIGGFLIRVANAEQQSFVPWSRRDLQSDRQPVAIEAAWYRQAWRAGQVVIWSSRITVLVIGRHFRANNRLTDAEGVVELREVDVDLSGTEVHQHVHRPGPGARDIRLERLLEIAVWDADA